MRCHICGIMKFHHQLKIKRGRPICLDLTSCARRWVKR